jgi:hypothetical protein
MVYLQRIDLTQHTVEEQKAYMTEIHIDDGMYCLGKTVNEV